MSNLNKIRELHVMRRSSNLMYRNKEWMPSQHMTRSLSLLNPCLCGVILILEFDASAIEIFCYKY